MNYEITLTEERFLELIEAEKELTKLKEKDQLTKKEKD